MSHTCQPLARGKCDVVSNIVHLYERLTLKELDFSPILVVLAGFML